MATVIIQDESLKITVVAPGGAKAGLSQLAPAGFFESLFRYKGTADVKTLKIKQDAQDPTIYRYEVELNDGKLWKQNITIASGQNTLHTFDVPVAWEEPEFISQRDLRAVLICLVREHGITELKCEW